MSSTRSLGILLPNHHQLIPRIFFLFHYSKYAKWIVNHNNKNSRLHIDRAQEFCTLWFSVSNFVQGSFYIVWVLCFSFFLPLFLLWYSFSFHALMTSRRNASSRVNASPLFHHFLHVFFSSSISIKKLTYLPDEEKKAERKKDIKNAMLTRRDGDNYGSYFPFFFPSAFDDVVVPLFAVIIKERHTKREQENGREREKKRLWT